MGISTERNDGNNLKWGIVVRNENWHFLSFCLANWSNNSNEMACKPFLLLNQQTIEALHTLHTFS